MSDGKEKLEVRIEKDDFIYIKEIGEVMEAFFQIQIGDYLYIKEIGNGAKNANWFLRCVLFLSGFKKEKQ